MTTSIQTNIIPIADSQERALKKMKFLALGLFLLVTCTFGLTRVFESQYPWLSWVRAFSEAAMIGALADWFAVTALFRHPFGINIPHTAIIPRNQARIGETLGDFIQSNFLSDEILKNKLAQHPFCTSIATWLKRPRQARKVSLALCDVLPEALRLCSDLKIRGFIERLFRSMFDKGVNLGPLLSDLVQGLFPKDDEYHLFEHLLSALSRAASQHSEFLREKIGEELPWYVPRFVHDRVYVALVQRLETLLLNAKNDPDHTLRQGFRNYIAQLARELEDSPDFQAKVRVRVTEIFSHPLLSEQLSRLWSWLEESAESITPTQREWLLDYFEEILLDIAKAIENDAEVRAKVDRLIAEVLTRVLREYREEIGGFISSTVRTWDSATLVDKVELQIGRDLQYIRINGTVVGGLVGLFLYAITLLCGLG